MVGGILQQEYLMKTYNSLPTRADMYSVAGFGYKHSMDTRLYRSTALSFKVGGKR